MMDGFKNTSHFNAARTPEQQQRREDLIMGIIIDELSELIKTPMTPERIFTVEGNTRMLVNRVLRVLEWDIPPFSIKWSAETRSLLITWEKPLEKIFISGTINADGQE